MRSKRFASVLFLFFLVVGAVACNPRLTPTRGALFGIYQQTHGSSVAQQKQRLAQDEASNGRKYDILHYYYSWGANFPTWREPYWLSGGRTPLLSWGSPTTTVINNGSQDRIIDARARALKALRRPVMLRWFWEMDGTRNHSRAVSPASYRAAFRRIVGRFRAAGATNVKFVWCATAYGFHSGAAPAWYPGDDVVDWTCADLYNWAPLRSGSKWTSFASIVKPYYQWAAHHPRPMMIGEFGVMEDPQVPGRKAQWLTDARNALKSQFPKIKATVYFNGDGEEDRPYVWDISTSASSKTAWRAWAQDRYFRPRG